MVELVANAAFMR